MGVIMDFLSVNQFHPPFPSPHPHTFSPPHPSTPRSFPPPPQIWRQHQALAVTLRSR